MVIACTAVSTEKYANYCRVYPFGVFDIPLTCVYMHQNVCMYACMYLYICVNVCMHGWMDGWMGGCVYKYTHVCILIQLIHIYIYTCAFMLIERIKQIRQQKKI